MCQKYPYVIIFYIQSDKEALNEGLKEITNKEFINEMQSEFVSN